MLTAFLQYLMDIKSNVAGAAACAKSALRFKDYGISDVCDETSSMSGMLRRILFIYAAALI